MILDRQPVAAAGNLAAAAVRRIVLTPGPATGALPAATGMGHWPSFRGREASGVSRWAEPARALESGHRRKHLVEDADPRARALEPDRVGRRDLRDQRHQQPQRCDVQTRPLRRRRCIRGSLGASLDAVRHRQDAPERSAGSAPRRKARRGTSGTSSRRMRAPRRPPTAASWWRGLDRRALCVRCQRRPALVGRSRPRRHGRVTTFRRIEWGPASSPIIWNGLVIVQCDTQADSFLLALNSATGKTVWKTDRNELPSWGTPTIVNTPSGPELVTNASNFVRGYDPKTGKSSGNSAAARRSRRRHRSLRTASTSSPAAAHRNARCSR